MRVFPWLLIAASLSCSHYSSYQGAQAAQAAGLAAIVGGVAAATAQPVVVDQKTQLAHRSESATVQCGSKASYRLQCEDSSRGQQCYYVTNFGREYSCATADCLTGPPADLVAWCEAP